MAMAGWKPQQSFNTSHVTLYHHRYVCIQKNSRRFNTSHVTLYHILPRNHLRMSVFQYISCYSLSYSNHLRQIATLCFNTSHVTLYHFAAAVLAFLSMFQYISCYSLSAAISDAMSALTTFQYISCYSLSLPVLWHTNRSFLFQYISCYSLSTFIQISPTTRILVSIHLMLLFIQHGLTSK